MAFAQDQEIGPDRGSLEVRTYREGVAARVGHDLVIEVTRWTARVGGSGSRVELEADPRSLEVREGLHGVKPLTDKDRAEIRKNIDEKILQGRPISFRSSAIHGGADRMGVEGELTLAGTTRPLSFDLARQGDGGVSGTVVVKQSDWGIKPYRGLMGALRVRDEVEVVFEARP